jgi:hypothetical protein
MRVFKASFSSLSSNNIFIQHRLSRKKKRKLISHFYGFDNWTCVADKLPIYLENDTGE